MQKKLLFKIDYVFKIPPMRGAGSFLAYSLLGHLPLGYVPVYGNHAPCRGFLQTYRRDDQKVMELDL